MEILHSVEGGDVEQWLNLETYPCVRDCLLSLSLLTLLSLYLHSILITLFASFYLIALLIARLLRKIFLIPHYLSFSIAITYSPPSR